VQIKPASPPPEVVSAAKEPWETTGHANGFDLIKNDLLQPLHTFLTRSEKLLERTKAVNLHLFSLEVEEICEAAARLRALLEKPKRVTRDQSVLLPLVLPNMTPKGGKPRVSHGTLLLIDDNPAYRTLLGRMLDEYGYDLMTAENGEVGLWLAQTRKIDVVLLDVALPRMSGYEVLKHLKEDILLRDLPVIVLSGVDQADSAARCLEMGAEDYLPKPFNPVILKARIESSLGKKRFRDLEHSYLQCLQAEQDKSEKLLLNILPRVIAERLKHGESFIVDHFPEATVLFGDLVGFTAFSSTVAPAELVRLLNEIFCSFDQLAEKHGLEKIKTLGDAYMAVGGVPVPRADHAEAITELALDMLTEIEKFNAEHNTGLSLRVGINSGPLVAGIIGINKFIYDLWGDTVNTASKMESHGLPSGIQVTSSTYELLKDKYLFEPRGTIDVKGKGGMETFLVMGRLT
jgi:class 3 adenylate cyclase